MKRIAMLLFSTTLFLSTAARAGEPGNFALSFDYSAAEEIVRALNGGSRATAQIDEILALPGVREMIIHAAIFDKRATPERFREDFAKVLNDETLEEDPFRLNALVAQRDALSGMVARLRDNEATLLANVRAHIAPFVPPGASARVMARMTIGGNSTGWINPDDTNVFYMNLAKFDGDLDGALLVAAHELYHVVQTGFMNMESTAKDEQIRRAEDLLAATRMEGSAYHVADFSRSKAQGSFVRMYKKEYETNEARAELNFLLFDTLLFRLYNDGDAPADALYNLAFSGTYDQPMYYVGAQMSRALDETFGRERFLALLHGDTTDFFLAYAELAAKRSDLPRFAPASIELIAKIREAGRAPVD